MDFDTYQTEAIRTASNKGDKTLIFALGLCGEAGEVADLIKKWAGHGHELDKSKVTKELGDVLWYVATLADQLGINLDVIASTNVAKLRARYPSGFSVEASKAKADEKQKLFIDAPGFENVLIHPGSLGVALTDSKPIEGTDLHSVEVLIPAPMMITPVPLPTAPNPTFGIPRGPDLEGLARREAGDMHAGSYVLETWPKPHEGSPLAISYDANGSPIE
jgi:NTP pyrophosphatase (non-canonical NTP hydrolase)